MSWKKNRELRGQNLRLSNNYTSRGDIAKLGAYISTDGRPLNFLISGGVQPADRYQPLYMVFESTVGAVPMIVLHDNDIHIEAMVSQTCCDYAPDMPLWASNQSQKTFEPFLGMNPMQVVSTLRRLATKLQYTVTPRFERVIRGHIAVLDALKIPVSLSGFYYLSQFYDMGEFHANIMALPCGEMTARRVWADMGVDDEGGHGQFDLFRAVINHLAQEAMASGWNEDNAVGSCNCIQAIAQGANFTLSINNMYTSLLLAYLVEELKVCAHSPYLLLIDDIKLHDEDFLEFLCTPHPNCSVGLVSENVVDQTGGEEGTFLRLAEKMQCMVFFKHSTGATAKTISEVFGRYDHNKVETSAGTSRGFFKFLPQDRHDDVRYSIENRFRVMPEEITALRGGQAIVFDTINDEIIHYN